MILSESEATLLLNFESHPSLEKLGDRLGRDISVLSRMLKRIAEKSPLLEKTGNRWVLTERGRRFNQLTRDYVAASHGIVQGKKVLRIGAPREFAARILAERVEGLRSTFEAHSISLLAFEAGVEAALIHGEIDLGFDCGKPRSPEIYFRQKTPEAIVAVASPAFVKKAKRDRSSGIALDGLPHILCDRLHPDQIMAGSLRSLEVAIHTNDIATARSLARRGAGWALLPRYCVQGELNRGELVLLGDAEFGRQKFGVWRLRSRLRIAPEFDAACAWLASIEL